MQPYDLPLFEYQGGLGRGGTARVALVLVKSLGRTAALKYPLPESESVGIDFAQLAKREQLLIGGLRYPGLVRVLGVSSEAPEYLLLELCQGPTLERVGRIEDLTACLNILSSVAVNLEFIRARGIIHGDLKPDNIYLPSDWESTASTPFFYTKLSDFSLGRLNSEPDSDRAGMGTVGYMAPETVIDSRTSHASDIFALGVIAYQILTGQHPFGVEDHDPVKMNSRVREDEPTPLAELRPDAPAELSEIVTRLLAKSESERPQSGIEVCTFLRKAGATYKFEKAIQPKHLIDRNESPEGNIRRCFIVDERGSKTLVNLAEGSSVRLRLLAGANHLHRNLNFSSGKFSFNQRVYLPTCLRQNALYGFSRLSLLEKKRAVRNAIIHADRELPVESSVQPTSSHSDLQGDLILQFLHSGFIRTQAATMAHVAEREQRLYDATHLYFRAGNLVGAERCCYQVAVSLRKEERHDDALAALTRVIRYARIRGEEFLVRQLLMLRGDILKELGEAERAEEMYRRMIELYEGQPVDCLLAETYKDIGDLFRMRLNTRDGIEALNRAIEIYQELGDELEISHTLNNLGNVHWIAGDVRSTITHYRKALKIQRRLNSQEDLASTLNNLGTIYGARGRYKRAVRLFRLSLKLKREIGNKGEIARTLNNLGFTYYLIGSNDKAITALSESLETNRSIGSKKELLFNFENLTNVMISAGKLAQSLGYLKEGMALASELNDKQHVAVFNLSMAVVLRYLGRVREADQHLSTARDASGQLDDLRLSDELAVEQALLLNLLGKKDPALDLLKKSLADNRQRNDKPRLLQTFIALSLVRPDAGEIREAIDLAVSLGMVKEERNLKFAQLRQQLDAVQLSKAAELMDTLKPELDSSIDGINLPEFMEIAG
ncbi:MAG TPA: tetratricopeptide repeat protein, partial [candidate division Zixibacteria bacterium]|nr:tetratricopeptide repeat protein [candidate division Zixibacteria bacterium]